MVMKQGNKTNHKKSAEGRSRHRNMKSIYYDRHTKILAPASLHPHGTTCHLRPNRYVFVGQFFSVPKKTNPRVVEILANNKIKLKDVELKTFGQLKKAS